MPRWQERGSVRSKDERETERARSRGARDRERKKERGGKGKKGRDRRELLNEEQMWRGVERRVEEPSFLILPCRLEFMVRIQEQGLRQKETEPRSTLAHADTFPKSTSSSGHVCLLECTCMYVCL
jgi:hypothetical protein